MAFDILRGQRQDLRVEPSELLDLAGVLVELHCADRRVVARVEDQHHVVTGVVGQRIVETAGSGKGELGGNVSDADSHGVTVPGRPSLNHRFRSPLSITVFDHRFGPSDRTARVTACWANNRT